MAERCQLIEKGQRLAKIRGLDTSKVNCPVIQSCDGSSCIYLSSNGSKRATDGQTRFFRRLHETVDIIQASK